MHAEKARPHRSNSVIVQHGMRATAFSQQRIACLGPEEQGGHACMSASCQKLGMLQHQAPMAGRQACMAGAWAAAGRPDLTHLDAEILETIWAAGASRHCGYAELQHEMPQRRKTASTSPCTHHAQRDTELRNQRTKATVGSCEMASD